MELVSVSSSLTFDHVFGQSSHQIDHVDMLTDVSHYFYFPEKGLSLDEIGGFLEHFDGDDGFPLCAHQILHFPFDHSTKLTGAQQFVDCQNKTRLFSKFFPKFEKAEEVNFRI
jgi:hypothetical protein